MRVRLLAQTHSHAPTHTDAHRAAIYCTNPPLPDTTTTTTTTLREKHRKKKKNTEHTYQNCAGRANGRTGGHTMHLRKTHTSALFSPPEPPPESSPEPPPEPFSTSREPRPSALSQALPCPLHAATYNCAENYALPVTQGKYYPFLFLAHPSSPRCAVPLFGRVTEADRQMASHGQTRVCPSSAPRHQGPRHDFFHRCCRKTRRDLPPSSSFFFPSYPKPAKTLGTVRGTVLATVPRFSPSTARQSASNCVTHDPSTRRAPKLFDCRSHGFARPGPTPPSRSRLLPYSFSEERQRPDTEEARRANSKEQG